MLAIYCEVDASLFRELRARAEARRLTSAHCAGLKARSPGLEVRGFHLFRRKWLSVDLLAELRVQRWSGSGGEERPSTVLQMLKQRVSRKMRKRRREAPGQLRLNFPEAEEEARSFWQPRFYDHNVRTKLKIRQKLRYMHRNPITRGLVQHPGEWPWSSCGEVLLSMDVLPR